MAKPDTDDGWIKLADELLAALMIADFRKREMVVLHEVFEQIFGHAKQADARIDPADIAERSGIARSSVWCAIGELCASGVMVHLEGYRYRFLKDYENWTSNGKRRFSGPELTWIGAAPERAHPRIKRKAKALPTGNAASADDYETNVDIALPTGNANPETALPVGNANPETALPTGNARTIDEAQDQRLEKRERRSPQPPEGVPLRVRFPPSSSRTRKNSARHQHSSIA